jgi:hypothetical protein
MVGRLRQAGDAAAFNFQRNDATTQRGSGRHVLPSNFTPAEGAARSGMLKLQGSREGHDIVASLRRCVVALKHDWPVAC